MVYILIYMSRDYLYASKMKWKYPRYTRVSASLFSNPSTAAAAPGWGCAW